MPTIFDLVDEIYLPSTITHNSTTNNTLVVYPFREFFFFYVYPVCLFFATAQSLVCTIVLGQRELRSSGPIFHYSLVNSIDATLGTFIAAFLFLVNCGSLCSTSYTYASEIYKIFAVYFLVTALYFHSSIVQIVISLHLYFTLVQKFRRFTTLKPVKVVLVIYIVSCLYGLFFATCFRILSVPPSDSSEYVEARGRIHEVDHTSDVSYYAHFDSRERIHGYMAIFMVAISNQLVLIILVGVNGLILHAVRQAMRNKMKMNPSNSKFTTSSSATTGKVAPVTSEIKTVSTGFKSSQKKRLSRMISIRNYAHAQRNFLIMVKTTHFLYHYFVYFYILILIFLLLEVLVDFVHVQFVSIDQRNQLDKQPIRTRLVRRGHHRHSKLLLGLGRLLVLFFRLLSN